MKIIAEALRRAKPNREEDLLDWLSAVSLVADRLHPVISSIGYLEQKARQKEFLNACDAKNGLWGE